MVSEQPMMDVLVIGIKIVQHHVSVAGVTGSEYDDLEMFAEVFEDLLSVRADVYAGLDHLACGEGYG